MPDEELLDSLYATSADADVWPQFLTYLSRRMNADWCGLISQNSGSAPQIDLNFGMPLDAVRLYKEHYSVVDPWFLAFRQRNIVEWTGKGSNLLSESQLERSEFYNDFFKAERYPAFYQCGTVLLDTQGSVDVLTILRDRQRRDYNNIEEKLLQNLTAHLRRALGVYRRTAQLHDKVLAAAGVVDSLDVGLIGLSTDHRICFTNNLADLILRDSKILRVVGGRLTAYLSDDSRQLSELLESAGKLDMSRSSIGALTVKNDDRSMHLTVVPFARSAFMSSMKMLIIISDPLQKPKSRGEVLIKLFGLSPAESRVTMLLLEGLDPRQISERTGTTENTVRFQIKAIFRKTGTGKQSQLVRLVSKLPGL